MKKPFETCTPGQVKRMATILVDSIPTQMPSRLVTGLTDGRLQSLIRDFWKQEQEAYFKLFLEKFEIVQKLETQFSWKWYGYDYERSVDHGNLGDIFPDQDSKRFEDFKQFKGSEYPQQVIEGKRFAVIVKAKQQATDAEFSEFVSLSGGLPGGRDSLIQTLRQHQEVLTELLAKDEWLIAFDFQREFPQDEFKRTMYPAICKEKFNGTKFAFLNHRTGSTIREGDFTFFLTERE